MVVGIPTITNTLRYSAEGVLLFRPTLWFTRFYPAGVSYGIGSILS
jgi:hypothetical protein